MRPIEIELLGQACIAIKAGSTEIVTDPWFSGPTHLGSWRAYPELVGEELERMRARIDRASHVYISHDHEDHFDPAFLATLSKKVLLVSDFRNRRMRERLVSLTPGHELRLLRPGQELSLEPELLVRIVPEQPRYRTNSMLCVHTPYGTLLDANDCGLSTAALQAIAKRGPVAMFLYTLNFMANGFPFPYLRKDDPKLRASIDAIRNQVVEGFRAATRLLEPSLAVAFAGPVTFADAVNQHLNDHPEALDWSRMVAELAPGQRIVWPAPYSLFGLDEHGVEAIRLNDWQDVWRTSPPPQGGAGLDWKAGSQRQAASPDLAASAAAFTARLGGLLDQASARVGMPLYLSTVDSLDALETGEHRRTLRVMLDPEERGAREVTPVQAEPPYLHIVSTPAILDGFLRGEVTLDDLLLSARARFVRDPDTFNVTLHNLLRFGHDPDASEVLVAEMRARKRSSATITVVAEGRSFTIPKFCPHEGESLELAQICGRRITCPRHRWSFDLESGRCVEGGDASVSLYDRSDR